MALGDFFARLTGRKAEPEPAPISRAPTTDDLLQALVRVEQMVADGAVPAVVASRVNRVVRIVRETIPRLGNLGGSAQAYSVMATATDYLPEAIGGYLRLPRQWADSRPVDRGKTSLMILIDQLDLLGSTMDKVFDAVNRADAAALIAHGRFLQEKFGTGSTGGSLALGATESTPPPDTGAGPLQPPPGRGGA
jgi:phage FluMu protein gp41